MTDSITTPSGWRNTTLGEILEKVNEKISVSQLETSNYISTENMSPNIGGVSLANGLPTIPAVAKFVYDDILFSNIRTYFKKLWFSDRIGGVSNDVLIFRGKQDCINQKFLFYVLSQEAFFEHTVKTSKGTKMPRGDKDAISKFNILLPPLSEQGAIADMLSCLDSKIELLRAQNISLEATAETIFQERFGKYTIDDELPDGWRVEKIRNLAEINTDNSLTLGSNTNIFQYLDTGSITKGVIESIVEYKKDELPSRARRGVKHNDIVYSTVRPNQEHYGIIRHPSSNLLVSTGFVVLTVTNLSPFYIYFSLTNVDMTAYLHSVAEGSTSTYPSIKPSDIQNIELKVPDNKTLNLFHDLCESAWSKIEINQSQIQSLSKTRDELLPRLMRGEVRVI